jgi:hypothetical protein
MPESTTVYLPVSDYMYEFGYWLSGVCCQVLTINCHCRLSFSLFVVGAQLCVCIFCLMILAFTTETQQIGDGVLLRYARCMII